MNSFQRAYFRVYDVAAFFAQTGRGYLKTKLVPARFGRFPVVRGKVKFHIRGEAVFGERFMALGDRGIIHISVEGGGRLTVGDHVAVGHGVSIDVWHDVRIGDRVMMAPNVTILDDNRHEIEPGSPLYTGPTIIGDNVWLAANVAVLPGVAIGTGSVIAAHSVVSRDIPPNSFAAGSPAKVTRALNVPERWSHRFGYERNDPGPGLWGSVRRAIAGDPNAAIAGEDADRNRHEVIN